MEPTLDNYKLSCELMGHSMDVRALASAKDLAESHSTIISGSRDKTVKVWKQTGDEYCESVTFKDHNNFVASVFYLEAEKWICTGSNDTNICIYGPNSYVPILILQGHESSVCSIAAGVQNRSIISGSWDKTARVWVIDETGQETHTILRGHEAAVWSVDSLPSQQKFITGSADKTILYWNLKGEKLRMLKGHTDCVRGILSFSDGSLVSCANDAIIRCWNDESECVRELSGHSNYIYAIAHNKALGSKIIVSCGEDSTLRMWNLSTGQQLGKPIVHPTQSIWTLTCLENGDIVTGSSDGVVRIFTKDPNRFAKEPHLAAFEAQVNTRLEQMNEEIGGVKKTDLPGPEALLSNGKREGQTLMVRHADGSVKCYTWEIGQWKLIGDVQGASGGTQSTSGKTLHEGKEYDYVFSVDISDTAPAIKLPYNRGEDPWVAAQAFINRHDLPAAYLDQVANFIIKNSDGTPSQSIPSSGYNDPFTGGSRYVPGSSNSNFDSSGNVDPFTGGSSYATAASQQPTIDVNFIKGSEKHFPVSKYVTFDNCDSSKILEKLKEFNNKLSDDKEKVSDTFLESIMGLTEAKPEFDSTSIEALMHLLRWPSDILFPVLDVARLAIRNEIIFQALNNPNFVEKILPLLNSSAANQLMIIRCLANIMSHETGRKQIDFHYGSIVKSISNIKSGSANLQIAIATFFLNITISQTVGLALAEKCEITTAGIVELLGWAVDLEACYRAIQALGNLTTTPFGAQTVAQVISVDFVMDKIRELSATPQVGQHSKINLAGRALLAAF